MWLKLRKIKLLAQVTQLVGHEPELEPHSVLKATQKLLNIKDIHCYIIYSDEEWK